MSEVHNKVKIELFSNLENSLNYINKNTKIILVGFDRIKSEEFKYIKTYNLSDLDRLVLAEGCKDISIIINTYTPLKSILISKLNFYTNMYDINFKVYVEYCNNLNLYNKFKKYDVIVERKVV